MKNQNIVYIPLVNQREEDSFEKLFKQSFLEREQPLYLENYPLVIFPDDFRHICFESAPGSKYKEQFSIRRARKILIIDEICKGNLPYEIIFQSERKNKSICILLDYAEFAMFLLPQRSKKGVFLRLLTIIAYGKHVQTVINKQKEKGIIMKDVSEAVRLRGSTTSRKPTDK